MVEYWDTTIFLWLNSWVGISQLFDWGIIFRAVHLWYIVLAALLLLVSITFVPRFRAYRRKNLEVFLFSIFAAVAARLGVTELIRLFYNSPRPFDLPAEVLTEAGVRVMQLVPHTSGGSFPSGHAAFAFAVATAVSLYYPKTGILFFLAAFSIGLGRVAAGVHWPSDILGGAVVGIATAWILHLIWRVAKRRLAPPLN